MMTRWIAATSAALMLAFGLALAVPYGNYASADGVSAPVYHRTALRKRCIAPADWWGRGQSSWICAAAETCCYDRLLRRGSCLAASQRCF
jgi:hypothetical protein